MSKSGLFGHFGSKEKLQLATIDHARAIFVDKIVEPSLAAPNGLPRLYAMQSRWIAYVQDDTFSGGCFFAAASAEFDGRPGPVRERIEELTRYWRDMLLGEASRALRLGHLKADADPELIAFQLHAFVQEANWAYQLLGENGAFDRARAATEKILRSSATPEGIRMTKTRRKVAAKIEVMNQNESKGESK